MPTPGLSLVGFLDQQEAINHLRSGCVPTDPADAALIAEWTAARTRLGAPIDRAGKPRIRSIPARHAAYIDTVSQASWVAPVLAKMPGARFMLVEIAPLLAFQFAVDSARSQFLCGALPQRPRHDELLRLCLPDTQPQENIQVSQQGQSMILKSRSLNFHVEAQGQIGPKAAGIVFGISLPLTHVVRFNGRCYLHNGFHRVYGAALAGAKYIPCLFRDVADYATAGIKDDGSTFKLPLLESANPPTMAHFIEGRAYDISLRALSRILHVSWADHVMPDE